MISYPLCTLAMRPDKKMGCKHSNEFHPFGLGNGTGFYTPLRSVRYGQREHVGVKSNYRIILTPTSKGKGAMSPRFD